MPTQSSSSRATVFYANRHIPAFLALPETESCRRRRRRHDDDGESERDNLDDVILHEGALQIVLDGSVVRTPNFFATNDDSVPLLAIDRPIVVTDRPESIGMKVPVPRTNQSAVSIRDIADIVGHAIPVSVIDVEHQEELEGWTMGDLVDYFEDEERLGVVSRDREEVATTSRDNTSVHPDNKEFPLAIPATGGRQRVRRKCSIKFLNKTRHRVLNQISLEFSKTRLKDLVLSPQLVRDMDWIDHAWPAKWRYEREVYPVVQYYCLTSAAGSFTDFHLDFGGTSVWYHVLSGSKVFCLIPPSPENLKIYEEWLCRKDQAEVFLPSMLEAQSQVLKIGLEQNCTMFIPSGWIHAVYTPEDSLVFGGNFLHGLSMRMQLAVNGIEVRSKVLERFRFPYFVPTQFYAGGMYLSKFRRGDIVQREVDGFGEIIEALEQWWKVQHNPMLRATIDNDAAEPTIIGAALSAATHNGCSSIEVFLSELRMEYSRFLRQGSLFSSTVAPVLLKPKAPSSSEGIIDVASPKGISRIRLHIQSSTDATPTNQTTFRIKIAPSSRRTEPVPATISQKRSLPREDISSFVDEEAVLKDEEWVPTQGSHRSDRLLQFPTKQRASTKQRLVKQTTARQRLLKKSKW